MTFSITTLSITTLGIKKYDTHHNYTQHNDTQHNGTKFWLLLGLVSLMLSVVFFIVMLSVNILSVAILSVIILNAVMPAWTCRPSLASAICPSAKWFSTKRPGTQNFTPKVFKFVGDEGTQSMIEIFGSKSCFSVFCESFVKGENKMCLI